MELKMMHHSARHMINVLEQLAILYITGMREESTMNQGLIIHFPGPNEMVLA